MESRDSAEIKRIWERQRLAILERSPALFQEIRSAITEGRSPGEVFRLIDVALDRVPTGATIVSAATQAFDLLRQLVATEERDEFLDLLSRVNQNQATPQALKARLFALATQRRATAILDGTYFDDVREPATRS